MSKLHASLMVHQLIETIDRFFAARWLWRLRQQRAEDRLDAVLNKFGELSFEARRAANHVSEMDFAVDFWRTAPPLVRRHILLATKQGVPTEDLRIMNLNQDLYLVRDGVRVRRSLLVVWLARASLCLVSLHGFLMMVVVIGLNVTWPIQLLVATLVAAVYLILYRGWSLYLGRASAAVRRSGERLETLSWDAGSALTAQSRSSVTHFTSQAVDLGR